MRAKDAVLIVLAIALVAGALVFVASDAKDEPGGEGEPGKIATSGGNPAGLDSSPGRPITGEWDPEGGDSAVVNIVGSGWYGQAAAWVGIIDGGFRKAGFRVNFRTVTKSSERMLLFASGEIQFASVGEISMLTFMANGNDAFYWVGSQDIAPGYEALVVNENKIKGWEDLKGKSIALTKISSIEITVRQLLAQNGLVPGEDVELINADGAEIPTVFSTGAADAVAIWQPYLGKVLEVPGAKVLGWDTDTEIYKKFKTMTGPDVLVIGRKWVDENPARARAFLDAYFAAVETVKNDPEGVAKRVVEKGFSKDTVETVTKALRDFVWQGAEVQRQIMSQEQLFGQAEYVANILKESGDIPLIPDLSKWVWPELLPE